MPNIAVRALGALALMTSMPASAAEISWTSAPGRDATNMQLSIERSGPGFRNTNSRTMALSELDGVEPSSSGPVRFALRRDAGTISCAGIMRQRRGAGTCSFTADPRFAVALAARGIARPDSEESYALTVHGISMTLVDALQRHGFPQPRLDELLALGVHGATPEWLAGIAVAGHRGTEIDALIAYRVHRIDGNWLNGMIDANPGLARASADQFIALKIHGATPQWVRGLADAGYRDITADDLTAFRVHGITPEFARAAASLSHRPDANELVALKLTGRNRWQ